MHRSDRPGKTMTPHSFDPTDNGGFSLLELLLVITVLGIMVSTAVVRWDLGGFTSGAERERLVQFLRDHHLRVLEAGRAEIIHWDQTESTLYVHHPTTGKRLDQFTLETGTVEQPPAEQWILRPSGFDQKLQLPIRWQGELYRIDSHVTKGAVVNSP